MGRVHALHVPRSRSLSLEIGEVEPEGAISASVGVVVVVGGGMNVGFVGQEELREILDAEVEVDGAEEAAVEAFDMDV
jgi:hypothetical protein